MMIEKTHVNATENYLLGEPIRDKIENTVLDGMTFGQMYRWFQSEGYGRCTSKVFVDTNNPNEPMQVGWVFLKRDKYEDTGETFLHETWVTLLKRHETIIEREYEEVA
jgi:hypothetical protein